MKKYLYLSLLAAVAIMPGCTKLTALEGHINQVETDLHQDHTNLPNGIILETQEINGVNKGDTVDLKIIVNPSDFVLSEKNLSLLDSHHLFTEGDKFDKSAHCDLSIIGLKQSDAYEGEYIVSVTIDGEGNFFDEISTYILYGEKNQENKTHYICSDNSAAISVIPAIKDAFCLEIPHQSFYTYKQEDFTVTPESPKTQYIGMWLKIYKDENGMSKAYDRSLISSVQLAGSECIKSCTLVSSEFNETGIIRISLKEDSQYWTDAIKSHTQEGVSSTSYPEGSILRFSRAGKENADYLLDTAKLFFDAVCEKERTVTLAELQQTDSIHFDISKELTSAGFDDSFKSLKNCGIINGGIDRGSGAVASYNEDTRIVDISFYNYEPIKQKKEVSILRTREYHYAAVQGPDGMFYNSTNPQEPKKYLLSFFAKFTTKLSD